MTFLRQLTKYEGALSLILVWHSIMMGPIEAEPDPKETEVN